MVNPNQKELVSPEDYDRADLEKNEEKAGKIPSEIVLNDYTKNDANITNIDEEADDDLDIVAIAHEIDEKRQSNIDQILEEARQIEEQELDSAAELQVLDKKPAAKKNLAPKKTTMKNNKSKDDNKSVAMQAHNRKYTSIEEMFICKAFIAASEDPIVGNKTPSAEFSKRLGEIYATFIADHVREKKLIWHAQQEEMKRKYEAAIAKRRTSHDSNKSLPPKPPTDEEEPEFHFDTRTGTKLLFFFGLIVPISYTNLTHFDCCICTGYNLWVHFRAIAKACIKFYSVQKQITLKSGEDKEMLLQRQFEVYKERHGSSFKYYPCAEYLSDKQKWVGVISKGDLTDTKTKNGGTNPKIERPIGKKRATKDKEKRDIVESIAKNVLSEFITDQKEISDKAKSVARSETVEIVKLLTEQKNKMFHDVFGSLQVFMKDMMQEQSMSSPENMALKKKKAELEMAELEAKSELAIAELKAKKAKLEQLIEDKKKSKENTENQNIDG
jgi:hypothetical protein